MRELKSFELCCVDGGLDATIGAQAGAAIGVAMGILYSLRGPMTGSALALKPFEMAIDGMVGGAIGTGVGILGAFAITAGVQAYENSETVAYWVMKLAALAALA